METPLSYYDDLTQIAPNIWANEAGVKFWENFTPNPQSRYLCDKGSWQCPWQRNNVHPPCRYKGHGGLRKNAKDLVVVAYENWTVTREPVGQMSLFEPGKTHRTVWKHWKTGEELEPYPLPVFADIVCKQMAWVYIRSMESSGFWRPPKWKLLPIRYDKTFAAWSDEMLEKHPVQACWFDTL